MKRAKIVETNLNHKNPSRQVVTGKNSSKRILDDQEVFYFTSSHIVKGTVKTANKVPALTHQIKDIEREF